MGKSIIAACLFSPFAVHAEKLIVEYEGTVSAVDRGSSRAEMPPYAVGDAIGGTLIIDTASAPADRHADDATVGRYYAGAPISDFVLGTPQPTRNGSGDLVIVYDDWQADPTAAREDGFFIKDRSIGIDGEYNLVLGLLRPNALGQLFVNDALAQSFTVEDEPGANLWGYVERGFGEFWRAVHFTLDRFSVKPSVCRAPD
jgi:hypothetical protein